MIYWWNSMTTVTFHDFPRLENSFLKFHDFPGYVGTPCKAAMTEKQTAYGAVKFLHCSQCVFAVLKVNEAIVLRLLHTSHLTIRLKHLSQFILSHQRLQILHIQHFHLCQAEQCYAKSQIKIKSIDMLGRLTTTALRRQTFNRDKNVIYKIK